MPLAAKCILSYTGPKADETWDDWSETVSFSIQQKPSFFSGESYTKYNESGGKKYHIKYRNFNIFSPGAGVTGLIEQGFDALNAQVLGALDQGFEKLENISQEGGEALRQEVEESLTKVADSITQNLSSALNDYMPISGDQESFLTRMGLLTEGDVTQAVNGALGEYSGSNASVLIHAMNDTTLQNDIAQRLQVIVSAKANISFADSPDLKEIRDTAIEVVAEQVYNAYDKAVTKTISLAESTIKTEFLKLSQKIEDLVGKKVSETIGSFIPSGLPILPPFGWWCTLNVWYIELEGDIPEFKVVDTQNEANTHPLWGHTAQEYFRTRDDRVERDLNGDGIAELIVGENQPVNFAVNTGTFIIVPPGKTGVGDRSGGWDEVDEFSQPS